MRRVRYALVALAVAFGLLVVVPHAQADDCSPLCAIYTSVWDPLYWFHGCHRCPPPSPEG
jgi:hypothetical protein